MGAGIRKKLVGQNKSKYGQKLPYLGGVRAHRALGVAAVPVDAGLEGRVEVSLEVAVADVGVEAEAVLALGVVCLEALGP